MKRGPYTQVAMRNAQLLERIRALKAEHPFWGYRRIWAHLRYVDGRMVNPKRVYGTMKANDLLVRPNLKLRAKRKADTRKPRPTRPNEWWGIDMTKVMIEGFGWVYLVVVLDWHTKKVVGHYAGLKYGFGAANVSVGYVRFNPDEGDDNNLFAASGDVGVLPGVTLKGDVTYATDDLNAHDNDDDPDDTIAGVVTIQLDY